MTAELDALQAVGQGCLDCGGAGGAGSPSCSPVGSQNKVDREATALEKELAALRAHVTQLEATNAALLAETSALATKQGAGGSPLVPTPPVGCRWLVFFFTLLTLWGQARPRPTKSLPSKRGRR